MRIPNETQMRRLAEFEKDIRPLMDRFRSLNQDQQAGVLESVLGAYVGEAEERNGGGMDRACDKATRLLEAMLKRQEDAAQ